MTDYLRQRDVMLRAGDGAEGVVESQTVETPSVAPPAT